MRSCGALKARGFHQWGLPAATAEDVVCERCGWQEPLWTEKGNFRWSILKALKRCHPHDKIQDAMAAMIKHQLKEA